MEIEYVPTLKRLLARELKRGDIFKSERNRDNNRASIFMKLDSGGVCIYAPPESGNKAGMIWALDAHFEQTTEESSWAKGVIKLEAKLIIKEIN